jgi:hypothetical protein
MLRAERKVQHSAFRAAGKRTPDAAPCAFDERNDDASARATSMLAHRGGNEKIEMKKNPDVCADLYGSVSGS